MVESLLFIFVNTPEMAGLFTKKDVPKFCIDCMCFVGERKKKLKKKRQKKEVTVW